MQTKLVIGVMVLLLILAGGYFFTEGKFGMRDAEPIVDDESMIEDEVPQVQPPVTYASSSLGFYLKHPAAFSVNESYAYEAFGANKAIAGVKFTIPFAMATGTNLSEDSGISVETLPRAKNCTGDIYLKANVKAEAFEENGMKYSLATSSEGAAGNMYEEWVYALADSEPCIAVRYFIHTTNIDAYDPGTVMEYDRPTLLAALDEIRRSVMLGSPEDMVADETVPADSGIDAGINE